MPVEVATGCMSAEVPTKGSQKRLAGLAGLARGNQRPDEGVGPIFLEKIWANDEEGFWWKIYTRF